VTLAYNTTGRRRVARKPRAACGGYCTPITPGEVYLEVVEFPGGESGYATSAGRPVRMAVCAPCALRDGSGILLLDPIPEDQCARQGLLNAS